MNKNQAILITGTSSGIGNACVSLFAAQEFKIFAGVRTKEDAEKLSNIGNNIYPLIIDVTNQKTIDNAYNFILKNLNGEKLSLINNAGVAISCPIEFINIEKLQTQFEINVIGQIRLIQRFLPVLRETKGKIINISSILGTLSLPYTSPYCASKSALDSLTDGLRLELKKWKIDVVLIKPGIVKTPIWQKSSNQAKKDFEQLSSEASCLYGEEFNTLTSLTAKFGRYGCSTNDIAKIILKAILAKKSKPIYFVGDDSNTLNFVRKFPQQILDKIILFSIRIGLKFCRISKV